MMFREVGYSDFELLTFSWYVTNACNYRCTYCIEEPRLTKKPTQQELQGYQRALMHLKRKSMPVFSLELVGGEPTLNAELPRILNNVDVIDNCIQYELITNLSRPLEYFNEICCDKSDKFVLKPSFHPEYYQVSFLQKIKSLSRRVNIKPTIIIHDNSKYHETTKQFLDALIENEIPYDMQRIIKSGNYKPVYNDDEIKTFEYYFKRASMMRDIVKDDVTLSGYSSHVPHVNMDGGIVNIEVMESGGNVNNQYQGYECTPRHWVIEPTGVISNSCTGEGLSIGMKELNKCTICQVKCGCVEYQKLYYHKKIPDGS